MISKRVFAVLGLAAALGLSVAGCGSSDDNSNASGSAGGAASASAAPSEAMADSNKPFGAACSQIPTDPANPGSSEAMAKAPVATAASGNPLLKTLVKLVGQEKLGDTLNGAPELTVFAPVDSAFAKIPQATLSKLTDAQIAGILKLHVLDKRIAPDQLAGSHATLNGGSVEVSGSGDTYTVKGPGNTAAASVICGNVQTANATVYLIDTVLMPAA